MVLHAEGEILIAHGLSQLIDQAAPRPHLHRGLVRERAVAHRKAVVVLFYRDDVLGAGLPERPRPGHGILPLGGQVRNEVLKTEPVLQPAGPDMMSARLGVLLAHFERPGPIRRPSR